MIELKTGDVIELPIGLHVYHNQGQEITILKDPAIVVVETTRKLVPFSVTGSEAHFEPCFMVKGRALRPDGSYFPEGALLTFAQYGDFRKDFILPDNPNMILRRMNRTFVP